MLLLPAVQRPPLPSISDKGEGCPLPLRPAIINRLNKLSDTFVDIGQIAVFRAINFLVFEGFHERLGLGIVVGIALATHANGDAMLLQQLRAIAASVLDALIRMMHQVWRGKFST